MQTLLNENWKFYLGDENEAYYKGYDDSAWKTVCLPHDWSVTLPFDKKYSSGTGYLAGGTGWYRKHFELGPDTKGKHIFVTFGGVYKNSRVWINSNYLGQRPYGYSTFTYDITDFVIPGENVLSVRVEHNDLADSRWFTGSGIYRDVTLTVKNPCHFAEYSVFASTKEANTKQAALRIQWQLTDPEAQARFTLLDENGAEAASSSLLPAEGTAEICVKHPKLWSPQSPYLYTLICCAIKSGLETDREDYSIGIRTIRFDTDQGFFLNSSSLKIKGLCILHDAGCLGAAVPKEVWRRRLEKFKECGANAIRTSHNPPDENLLSLCDEMGFLVMDEAFDEWEGCKNKWWQGHNVYPPRHYGYSEAFPEWHERDLSQMVLRDRNHPSVIMWSIGNEIDYPNDPYVHPLFQSMTGNNDANKPSQERQYDPNKPNAQRLATLSAELVAIVKRHDDTRPVTSALAFPELSNQTGYAQTLDIVGYNYKEHLYEEDHKKYPHVIYGSENSTDPKAWLYVKNNDYICGQFLWTGIDFLGEAQGWPIRISQAGILNLACFEKPLWYQRKAIWTEASFCKLASGRTGISYEENFSWNWEEGEEITVSCYTNCETVQLFLNGTSLGEKKLSDDDCGRATWKIPFEKGIVKAICKNGCETVEDSLITAGKPVMLQLKKWENSKDDTICQVEILAPDENGNLLPGYGPMVFLHVIGNGTLLGIENGGPDDLTSYTEPARRTLNGRLLAYIRKKGEKIRLIAWSEELGETELKL